MTTIPQEPTVADPAATIHDDLKALVKIKSVNIPGNEESKNNLKQAREAVIALFKAAGIKRVEPMTVTHQGKTTTPFVYGEHPGPAGAKTVLLYAHYDVQPADGAGWKTKPFEPTEYAHGTDTRLRGRGAADDKSGICMHLATVRDLVKSPLPVRLKLLIEGEEETGASVLEEFILANPRDPRFQADVVVVADTGNIAVGTPTLTSTLRGIVAVDVTVTTLRNPVHSGEYGGPVPDAYMALTRLLATLHNDKGQVAVPGLAVDTFTWAPVDATQLRTHAGVLDNVALIGSGSLAQRLYGKPSINVVGLSGPPPLTKPANVLCHTATARVSVRLAPSQDPNAAYTAVATHLQTQNAKQWDVPLTLTKVGPGTGFKADSTGKYYVMAKKALSQAYGGKPAGDTGQGGSIPLVAAFKKVNPTADMVLWGCEEPLANIHAPNESVSYTELKHMTTAQKLLLTMMKT